MSKAVAWWIIGIFLWIVFVIFIGSLIEEDVGVWTTIVTGIILLLAILIAVGVAIVTVLS